MNDKKNNLPRDSVPQENEIGLFDFLFVLARRLKLLFGVSVATFLLACAITLAMPNIYTATARILPPPDPKGALTSMLGNMGGLASLAGITGGTTSAELYVGMLKSRSVADAIIDRFELMNVYGSKTRAGAYDTLSKNVGIELGKKDGIITVNFDDGVPERAKAIANAFVAELKRLNVELNLSNVSQERSFLDGQREKTRRELERAEEVLRDFQEKHKTVRLDEQAIALIEAVANLRAELANKEVQVGVLLTRQTEGHPEVKAVREGIARIREQILRLEKPQSGKETADGLFLATSELPELNVQYVRLLRDLKVQETLFDLLTRQRELTKINEAKDVSSIQVLDEAVVPDRKSGPRRSLLVLGATALAFVLSIFLAFTLEYVERMPETERLRWRQIRAMLPLAGKNAGRGRGGEAS